jgi:hypothetical protein
MADGRAETLIVAPGKCGLDVILVASGHAKPGDVDQQILAFLPHGRRQPIGTLLGNALR